ncbi:hypothetical protein U1Q18_051570 [Sarracenia purpurea var. burkii]
MAAVGQQYAALAGEIVYRVLPQQQQQPPVVMAGANSWRGGVLLHWHPGGARRGRSVVPPGVDRLEQQHVARHAEPRDAARPPRRRGVFNFDALPVPVVHGDIEALNTADGGMSMVRYDQGGVAGAGTAKRAEAAALEAHRRAVSQRPQRAAARAGDGGHHRRESDRRMVAWLQAHLEMLAPEPRPLFERTAMSIAESLIHVSLRNYTARWRTATSAAPSMAHARSSACTTSYVHPSRREISVHIRKTSALVRMDPQRMLGAGGDTALAAATQASSSSMPTTTRGSSLLACFVPRPRHRSSNRHRFWVDVPVRTTAPTVSNLPPPGTWQLAPPPETKAPRMTSTEAS